MGLAKMPPKLTRSRVKAAKDFITIVGKCRFFREPRPRLRRYVTARGSLNRRESGHAGRCDLSQVRRRMPRAGQHRRAHAPGDLARDGAGVAPPGGRSRAAKRARTRKARSLKRDPVRAWRPACA